MAAVSIRELDRIMQEAFREVRLRFRNEFGKSEPRPIFIGDVDLAMWEFHMLVLEKFKEADGS